MERKFLANNMLILLLSPLLLELVCASALFEKADTPLDIDTAFVDIEFRENALLSFGQMYAPFGEFHTHQISDSSVQVVTEARDTIVKVDPGNVFNF